MKKKIEMKAGREPEGKTKVTIRRKKGSLEHQGINEGKKKGKKNK